MGEMETKLKIDEEEKQSKPLKPSILLGSDDDEETKEDLSLKIVEKAIVRPCSTTLNEAVLDPSSSPLLEASEAVDDTVVVDKEIEKAVECETLETDNLVEEKVDITDNIVLRKLLRGPRYFDPPDNSWGTCYNCGEEGHTAVNCTSAKRRRPCFVCGSLEHNVKQCVKGKDCYICKQGGHRAKDCPEKKFAGRPPNAKICLKCGQPGHELFSCNNDYSFDDLKEIHCYVCKSFGHLCCVNYSGTARGEVSCYRCGQSGHTGLACTKSPGEPYGTASPSSCYRCGEGGHFARECTSSAKACKRLSKEPYGLGSPSSCYKCGEEGHFARECTSSAKKLKRNDQSSTPKRKRSKQHGDHFEGRSWSRDLDKGQKRKRHHYEGRHSAPSKSKGRFGWTTEDPGDSYHTPTTRKNKFSHGYTKSSRPSRKTQKLHFSRYSNSGIEKL